MGKFRRIGTLLGSSALVLGTMTLGVTGSVITSGVASAAAKPTGCVVLDTGGVNDKSFNQSAWQGAQAAAASNKAITVKYLTSTSSADYTSNINTFISQGCGIIVTVGYLMGDATTAAAKANPDQLFAIVDSGPPAPMNNLLSLSYRTDQGAFLGGYLAAASTKTGKVATFGGINIPPVTIYMNGFVAGVKYYNKMNNKSVTVLGWTPSTTSGGAGTGTFANSFTDQTAGNTITTGLFAQGADIVFPVAGSVGLGSLAAAKTAGKGHQVLWVDFDAKTTNAKDVANGWFLGTVLKGVSASVKNAITSAKAGTFTGGTYTGTTTNGGTGFAFNDAKTSAALKAKIATIAKGIADGSISVDPAKY